jgi:hypothetical protein
MATTVKSVKLLDGYPQAVGAKYESMAFMTLQGTYDANRIPVQALQFGIKYLEHLTFEGDLTGTYSAVYVPADAVHGTIVVQVLATGAELGAVSLTGIVLIAHARGF